ncbi:hypothetical protein A3K64_01555 [Candidatus Micrarchaeota archaeon RBG_16_36_9]|nr:MAG: hypothetical protein A3K64_01555 [Candidatus Micrarchaeota archaeon RBG_16_36_9]
MVRSVSATSISSCRTISTSGTYTLTNNISGGYYVPICININASSVTLDCNGYNINAPDWAIFSENTNNINIQNCLFYASPEYNGCVPTLFLNSNSNTMTNNYCGSFVLVNSDGNTITNNFDGGVETNGTGSTISNNNGLYGYFVGIYSGSNNLVSNNNNASVSVDCGGISYTIWPYPSLSSGYASNNNINSNTGYPGAYWNVFETCGNNAATFKNNSGNNFGMSGGINNTFRYNNIINGTFKIMGGINNTISENTLVNSNIAIYGPTYMTVSYGNILNGNTLTGGGIYNEGNDSFFTNNKVSSSPRSSCFRISADRNFVSNNEAYNCYYGLSIFGNNNSVVGNRIENNNYGITFAQSVVPAAAQNNVIKNNYIKNNSYGFYNFYSTSSNNSIYNNYFNNTINAKDIGTNYWNTTKSLGTNIIGGPFIGGNYWSDYTGNDTDGDGIGSTSYVIPPYGSNIDYLPLTPTALACGATLIISVNVTNDPGVCSGDGIKIGAENIVIDFQGHNLTGSGSGEGIVANGIKNFTIKNVTVENFDKGLSIKNANRVAVYDVTLKRNHLNEIIDSMGINIISIATDLNNDGLKIVNSSDIGCITPPLGSPVGNCITSKDNTNTGIEIIDSKNIDLKLLKMLNNQIGMGIINSANTIISGGSTDPNEDGIVIINSSNITVKDGAYVDNIKNGILVINSTNVTITNNTIINNSVGINLTNSNNNLIYNNLFNNTYNVYDDGINFWNISKTLGKNIVRSSYLGGNYWSDYNGNDTDNDGIGDTNLPYNSNGRIVTGGDYLPILPPFIDMISPINNYSYYKAYVPLNFIVSKPTSWIKYSLNNTPNITITGPVNLTNLTNRWNNVTIYVNDTSGNMDSSFVKFFCCLADVNGDKLVNMRDINLLIANFNYRCDESRFNPMYDLNDDCVINMRDINIAIMNFNKNCV